MIDAVQQALSEHQRLRAVNERIDTLRNCYDALRPKERRILVLVAEGLTSREIAERLDVSAKTVDVYRLRSMKALGAGNLAELVRICVALGLVDALPGNGRID
nr:LuxR C-terminal-related transcriptional regulator [Halomonas sp.]